MNGKLILENGRIFKGKIFGYNNDAIGEVVFTTGMAGYQEVLTDPAYFGQVVVMTYPIIGNYGINLEDVESDKVQVSGLVVREKCDIPNNFRCELSLENYLKQNKIIGLCDIDTRALTKVLRNEGTMRGIIISEENKSIDIEEKIKGFSNKKAVEIVSRKEISKLKGDGKNIVIVDLGVNNSTIKWFKKEGYDLTIVPYSMSSENILKLNPDLVLISGGPGNPNDLEETVDMVKELVGKVKLSGLGLGHQIIAIATGCRVNKLKYGHRGCNHPVKSIEDNKVVITAQNHGYFVDKISDYVKVTHINVNDETIAGLKSDELNISTIQFSPEACLGTESSDKAFRLLFRYID